MLPLKNLNIKKKWLVLGFAISFLLAEIFLRFFSPYKIVTSIVVKDPIFGYLHKSNVTTQYLMDDRFFQIHINQQGLRQPNDIVEKSPDEFRILFLGDSTLFGWGVNYEDTFFAHLQKRVKVAFPDKKITLLNAGHGGWGEQQMVAFFELRGINFSPDMVVLVMGPQDVEDNRQVPIYLENGDDSELSALSVPKNIGNRSFFANHVPLYDWLSFNSMVLQLVRLPAIAVTQKYGIAKTKLKFWLAGQGLPSSIQPNISPTDPFEGFNITKKLFSKLNVMCSRNKISLLVTNIGHGSYTTGSFFGMEQKFFEKEKISYIDLLPILHPKLNANPEAIFRKNDTHYTEYGNELYANTLWPFFKRELQRELKKRKPSELDLLRAQNRDNKTEVLAGDLRQNNLNPSSSLPPGAKLVTSKSKKKKL